MISVIVIYMIRLQLSDDDKQLIAEAIDDPELDERSKRRLLVVRFHCENVPHRTIASALNLSVDTVTDHLKEYQARPYLPVPRRVAKIT